MRALHSPPWDPRGASLLLAGAMCVIPFLQPRHFPPLRTFYDEWFAFALGLAAIGFAAAARHSKETCFPPLALWLGAYALFLAGLALGGQSAYPQGPLLWALYALFGALIVVLGYDLAAHFGRDQVCDVLAAFLLAGAALNAMAGVLQVIGIPRSIDDFVSYLHGGRAIGNVGQANLYANYLALGEASLAYLFGRGNIGRSIAIGAGGLLVFGAALAGSRTATLYAVLFALMGFVAVRGAGNAKSQRLGAAAIALASSGVLMQWLAPIGLQALGFSIESGFDRKPLPDWDSVRDQAATLRVVVWELAWRLIQSAPWMGVGPGEFAGAGFAIGLPPALAAHGIWTSPHNLILQLLSETGIAGAGLVGIGLVTWLYRASREFSRIRHPALWWVMACTGVEFVHALLEYPFWYAHFLAMTALIMGIGSSSGMPVRPLVLRTVFASSVIVGMALLTVNLRDYLRFDLLSPMIAGRSLSAESELVRDRATLAQLSAGLLAPRVELWLFMSFPLDSTGLGEKIAVGERLMRTWPSLQVVIRQCIFLAMAGRNAEAVSLLGQAQRTFTNRQQQIRDSVDSAPDEARKILQPALQNPK